MPNANVKFGLSAMRLRQFVTHCAVSFVVSRLNPWEGQYAAFGVSNLRYKGQKLYDQPISMEEFEKSAAEHK